MTAFVDLDLATGALSPATLLVLTQRGIVLPSDDGTPPHPLRAGDLHLLTALAGGAALSQELLEDLAQQHDEDVAGLTATLDALRRVRRLSRGDTTRLPPSPLLDAPDERSHAPSGATTGNRDDPGRRWVIPNPVAVGVDATGFIVPRRVGSGAVRFTADELIALVGFRRPATIEEATKSHRQISPSATTASFVALVDRWIDEGVLVEFDPDDPAMDGAFGSFERERRAELNRVRRLVSQIDRRREERRSTEGPTRLTAVYPVQSPFHYPHLALGLIFAYAKVHRDGILAERYDLDPHWLVRKANLRSLLEESGPSVFLFSNYLWSSESNLELSAMVKEWSPESVTVHGGPDAPRYEADAEQFFAQHPHVDVLVRGEGEITTAELLEALPDQLAAGDLDALREVPGLTYRVPGGVVRTPDRERLTDLDVLPSPYLSGTFDDFAASTAPLVILETNRGCPYGCTFCDWGSATLSRIRKFSLDRVVAEIDWIGRNQMPRVVIADANFGILERDVDIARAFAETKQRYGFPREVKPSYAKNSTKHLRRIVKIFVDAGVTTEGILSLQTNDPGTLRAVKRTNIKLEKYDELAATFRNEGLPLYTDLMIGLPGATVAGFDDDLQLCMDREVMARLYRTEVLINSPMNAPSYRDEHAIVTEHEELPELRGVVKGRRPSLLVSTSSYTAEDLRVMMRHRQVYGIAESFGLLRHVLRWARQETGEREVDLLMAIDRISSDHHDRYPSVAWTLDTAMQFSIPPLHWSRFFSEVHSLLVDELGVPDGSALDTVLAVQEALVPAAGRDFPCRLDLAHDYVAWFQAMLRAKDQSLDWPGRTPRLGSFGRGALEVDDPTGVCTSAIGDGLDLGTSPHWELASPVSRAILPMHLTV